MFRTYTPGQGQLPMHLDDLIPEGDLVRVVHEVVERLDISRIVNTIKARKKKSLYRGAPAYHPRLLLKLLFYGYCTGTTSSRKLASQTHNFIPMMWLAGNEHPDFRTISDFRTEHRPELAKLFTQFLSLAIALGMVTLEHVAIDGSRFKANASKNKGSSRERLQEKIPRLREEVERLLQQAEETDRAEDQQFGDSEGPSLPKELKDKQARLKRMEQALATLNEQEERGERSDRTPPEKQSINYIDPDSRVMARRNGGSIQGYNGQIAVDGSHGVVVGNTLSNNPIDTPQLVPTLDAVQEATGRKPDKVSVDTGYHSGDNLAELEARGIDGYVADDRTETKTSTNPYAKGNFTYDSEQDAYRCPEGHWLSFHKEYPESGRWYKNPNACKDCPVRHLCTKSKHRSIVRDQHEALRDKMRTKLQTPEGKHEYSRRKGIVEPVWGHIKQVLGYTQVSFRGLEAVRDEFQMVCSAINLKKIAAKLRAKPELWSVVSKWTPTCSGVHT